MSTPLARRWLSVELIKPRTHVKICDIKNFWDQIFVQIWQFWCRWKAGDEIYSNLAKLNWTETQICQNRKFGFRVKDQKFGFELGLRIWNFRFSRKYSNFDKKQNSATVVYHNFAISSKFESQNFPKLVRILANNPYKIFSKFWSRYQNHQNLQNWLKSPKFYIKNS